MAKKATKKKKGRKRKKKETDKFAEFEFPSRKRKRKQVKRERKLSQKEQELKEAKIELANQRKKKRKENNSEKSKTASLEKSFLTQPRKKARKETPKRKEKPKVQFPLIPDNVGEPSPTKQEQEQLSPLLSSQALKDLQERERLSPIANSQSAFFSDDDDLEDFKILTGPAFEDETDENDPHQSIKGKERRQTDCLFDDIVELFPDPSPPQSVKISQPLDPLEEEPLETSSILLRSPNIKQPTPFLDLRSPQKKELKEDLPEEIHPETEPVLDSQTPESIPEKKESPKKPKAPDISDVDISGLSQKGYSASRKSKKKKRKRRQTQKQKEMDPIFQKKAKQEMEDAIEFYKSVDSMEMEDCFMFVTQN